MVDIGNPPKLSFIQVKFVHSLQMNTYSNTCESDLLEPSTPMTPTHTCLTPEDSTKSNHKALTIQVPLERHQIYLAHADECAGMESGTQLTGTIHWERCLRL